MTRYAADTQVSADRSRAEIEKILDRYGAAAFMYGWSGDSAVVQFRAHDRLIKFVITMPEREEFETTATGRSRQASAITAEWEQAKRQRWRALALVIKAKLEAVETGIAEFEDEFLAYTVLPNGSTVGEWIQPQMATAYETAEMPRMLLELEAGR